MFNEILHTDVMTMIKANRSVLRLPYRWLGRGILSFVVILGLGALQPPVARSSYEIPIVDSTTTGAKAEFRGIWSVNRGTDNRRFSDSLVLGSKSLLEGYESIAVGVDPTLVDGSGNPDWDRNGVLFYYNGKTWTRPTEPFRMVSNPYTTLPVFGMNAVAGQMGNGYGGPVTVVVGANHRAAVWRNTMGQPGDNLRNPSALLQYYDRFERLRVSNTPTPESVITNSTKRRDFYAVDAATGWGELFILGGQTNGQSYAAVGATAGSALDLTVAADVNKVGGTLFATGDQNGVTLRIPRFINPAATAIDSANENIVGIKVLDKETVYIVTSTFNGNDRYSVNGRTCDTPGSQRWRLYRMYIDRDAVVTDWEKLLDLTGGCAYAVSAGYQPTGSVTYRLGQRNPHIIWVATNDGIVEYREPTSGWNVATPASTPVYTTLASPAGVPSRVRRAAGTTYYSISSVRDRGGENVNLIDNGAFDRWDTANFKPSTWTDISATADFWNGATCAKHQNYQKHTSGNFIEIFPWKPFREGTNCTGLLSFNIGTMGVFTSAEVVPYEGQTFRLKGRYRVTFEQKSGSIPMPKFAQGGVSVGCAGGNDQAGNFRRLDCSINNRSLFKTYIAEIPEGDTVERIRDESMADWETFDILISRDDLNMTDYTASDGNVLVSPRLFNIQVACEATYGAKVWCDDISIEEVTVPPTKARNTYYVAAVGKDGAIVSSDDAMAASPVYAGEPFPTSTTPAGTTTHFNAIHASGVQHSYTAGSIYNTTTGLSTGQWNTSLYSRIPSSLKGYIQVGTIDKGLDNGTILHPGGEYPRSGVISVGCLNDKDPITQTTLCQRSSDSYGISLEVNGAIKTGTLRGRAWFGKEIGPSNYADNETANGGTCLSEGQLDARSDPTVQPYNLTGVCDRYNRLCWGNAPASPRRVHSQVSCRTDFDCYGRCSNDGGRICVQASDCAYGPNSALPIDTNQTTGKLVRNPGKQLICSIDSPQSCTSFGWLSFDPGDASGTDPNNASLGVVYNTLATDYNVSSAGSASGGHEFRGSAQFLTPATLGYCSNLRTKSCSATQPCGAGEGTCKNRGWVSFRGDPVVDASSSYYQVGGVAGNDYMYACQDCFGASPDIRCAFCTNDNNRSCRPSDVANQASCTKVCSTAPHAACTTDGECGGGKCVAGGVCRANRNQFCSTDSECGTGDVCLIGLMCKAAGNSCAAYGVNYSSVLGQYSGYAWSEDFGWLGFSAVGNAGVRFIQTRLGDIRAGGSIGDTTNEGQRPSADTCNSTYLIIAGTGKTIASNWCSALAYTVGGSETGFRTEDAIPLPTDTTYYTNALGRIDVDGLLTPLDTGENKYGQAVVPISDVAGDIAGPWKAAMTASGNEFILGGKVYDATCSTGTCRLSTDLDQAKKILTFAPAGNLATDGSGAGILHIRGNLIIDTEMAYSSTSISDARQLASLTIIVDGDITVNSGISEIVGAYFTLPDDTTPRTFFSTDGSISTVPLKVSGILVAQKFVFRRSKGGTVERPAPSELVIYDGRLQINPPASLIDFTRALPVTRAQP